MLLFQPQRYAYRAWWVFFLVFAGVTVTVAQDQILTLKAGDHPSQGDQR